MNKSKRLAIYERFFHKINVYCIAMDDVKIREAIDLIDSWSYMHRVGNGELSDKEQQKLIDKAILKMEKFQ